MAVKKKAGNKAGKVHVKDLTASAKERSGTKNEKDDPKGGVTYNFTPAWPKK